MNEITLDGILLKIGQFGKFQAFNYFLLIIPMFFNSIFSVTYIFTASPVVHRCNITECDSPTSCYNEPWTNFTIPHLKTGELHKCNRYSYVYDAENPMAPQCLASNFSSQNVEQCDSYIFQDKTTSISNDFGILCKDEWLLSFVGTIHNIGQFVGIPLGGFISDRYGRRMAICVGGTFSAVMGIIRSFSTDYTMFAIFEFLDAVGGSSLYASVFILGIELIGPKKRVFAASFLTIFYAIGEIIFGLVAKYIDNWRVLLRVMYIPALFHICLFWILTESVRWLLSQRKEEEAKNILRKAAKYNKRRLSESILDGLIETNKTKMEADKTTDTFPIRLAFKSFFWRIVNCSICWFTNVLVYYGLSLNSVLLGGNKYNNFMMICAAEIPGFLLPVVIMDRIGRRYSLFIAMLVSGISIGGSIFVPQDQHVLALVLFLIGKFAITTSFQVLYFATAEIFPTNVRHSLLSFCSMFGRFGAMVAPMTPYLANYFAAGPSIIFSLCAIVSGVLALFFKETTEIVLPSTLDDAETLGLTRKEATES